MSNLQTFEYQHDGATLTGRLATPREPGPRPAEPGAVKAQVLVSTGALDPFAPPSDVQSFQEEMAAAAADWHLTIYGKGYHAFTNPAPEEHQIPGVRYDARLDDLSWAQAMAFLEAFSPPGGTP